MRKAKWLGLLLIILFILTILFFNIHKKNEFQIVFNRQVITLNNPKLLAMSQSLANTGFLVQKDNKMVFLKVSDDYINKLYPLVLMGLLQNQKNCLRSRMGADSHDVGAHITLFSEKKMLSLPKQSYPFFVKKYIQAIIFKNYYGTLVKETWYELTAEAPSLIQDFKQVEKPDALHISIAVARIRLDNHQCYRLPFRIRLLQWIKGEHF